MFHERYVDPGSHKLCSLERKKIYAPGFKICDLCVSLKLAVTLSKGKAAKADAKAEYRAHKHSTYKDREALNTIKDLCRGSDIDVGCTIDCPDSNKFQLPTTKNKAAVMGGLSKIKNKITAVEFFTKERTILMYRTLPDVRTGNNVPCPLTITPSNPRHSHTHRCEFDYDRYNENDGSRVSQQSRELVPTSGRFQRQHQLHRGQRMHSHPSMRRKGGVAATKHN